MTLAQEVRALVASGVPMVTACKTVAADTGRDAGWLYKAMTGRKLRV